MVRTAVNDGTGDDNTRFVFLVASDEASCIDGERHAFKEPSKGTSDQGAACSCHWTEASRKH